MISGREVLQYWGKARASDDATVSWHPVAYHLLDVAAVADRVLCDRPLTRQRAAWLLGTSEDAAHQLIVSLAALHDIGKFTPRFQSMANPRGWTWPNSLAGIDASRYEKSVHTTDGLLLWDRELRSQLSERLWSDGTVSVRALECAVFGHHGRPVDVRRAPLESVFSTGAIDAARTCADLVLDRVHATPIDAPIPNKARLKIASWWLAGLLTLCDWVGSSDAWFPYVAPIEGDHDLAQYWDIARTRARRAVDEAGLRAIPSASLATFESLTKKGSPTPTQLWAATVELPNAPMLAIIEDATGSGKTEAAQMLVHRLMATGRATGAYWAMPTQATANAMYERQHEAIGALFATGGARKPSLTLGHGQARLHDEYRATVLPRVVSGDSTHECTDNADSLCSASAACAAFLADDRRASLLADIGAGTVDQVFLGVLPTRFNALRLFAVAEKVLVFDEVHAFDAYMSTEATHLLRFHAALGGSAVLLSATLTEKRRREFEGAWNGSIENVEQFRIEDEDASVGEKSSPYPMATMVSADDRAVSASSTAAAPWTIRNVPVRMVHSVDAALAAVVSASNAGAAVLWIRNTVDECLRAAAMLEASGIAPIVFHARFAQGDRQHREREVVRRFGMESTPERRKGTVLVATQVVEQSLDLDFDAMVTDLAPIDLLIQRAGRLWRHATRDALRPIGLTAELVVLAPAQAEMVNNDWCSALLPGTRAVYPDVGVLWRTHMVLASECAIRAPDGLRELLRRVYEASDVPDALIAASDTAKGKSFSDEAIAEYTVLVLNAGYSFGRSWSDDLRARTRLGDEQVVVRLARVGTGRIRPWYDDASMPEWKRWLLSEVKLSAGQISRNAEPTTKWRTQIDAVRAEWGRFEQDTPVIVLDECVADVSSGVVMATGGKQEKRVEYTTAFGLRYVKE